jgi:hypothetical protein
VGLSRTLGLILGVTLVASGCFLDRSGFVSRDSGSETDAGPPIECEGDADCDDGVFCNGFEICAASECTGGTPPACGDGIDCTLDVCDEVADACVRLPDHAMCDGDELCDLADGCTPREPCDAAADCDDGFACNGPEQCEVDRCAPGTPPSCDDAVSCTVDACSETRSGCVNVPDDGACAGELVCDAESDCVPPVFCTADAECDDGNFCDGSERCVSGRCAAGTPPSCNDAIGCTVDACDELANECVNVPDHTQCPFDQQCIPPGGCTFVGDCDDPSDCDDGFFCNGAEGCVSGNCAAGTAPTCADTVACTRDLCDEGADRCRNLADDTLCSANFSCDAAAGCVPECATDGECDDGLFCNGAERCASNACVAGTPPSCGDTTACTTDLCDETANVCRSVPNDAACASNETCVAGTGCVPECTGSSDCDDGLFCNGAETCVSGGCAPGTAPSCGDTTACTTDLCDETANLCRNVPNDAACAANETCVAGTGCVPECTGSDDCDDGLFCNGAETCVSGGCVAGTAPSCGDTTACTTDLCDETANLCRNVPNDAACAANETCVAGTGCVPECTGNDDCDDGLFCNGAETCTSGACVAGTAPSCSDGVACTNDLCDEIGDACVSVPVDGACPANHTCDAAMGCVPECDDDGDCDDGLFCNGTETCASNGCVAGTAPSCSDGISCTVDLCDEAGDRCLWVDDDLLCSAGEVCVSTGCAALGSSAEHPGTSCDAILTARPSAPSAAYWIDPDGASGEIARQLMCDMTSDGGGWTLILETDESSAAHYTELAVNAASLATGTIEGVAKLSDSFVRAIQTASTGELRLEIHTPGAPSFLFVDDVLWSVPDPGAYTASIQATTDVSAGYGAGTQCYDGDGTCGADHWCFSVDTTGPEACVRRSATAGLYYAESAGSPDYFPGRVWVR